MAVTSAANHRNTPFAVLLLPDHIVLDTSSCFGQTRTRINNGKKVDHRPKLNREGRAWVLASVEIKQVFAESDLPRQLIVQLCDDPASRVGEIVSLKRAVIIEQMVDLGLGYPSPLLIPMIAATASILL